ncbi:MAG: hypothetical protein US70_C0008G0037 [Parcubacteria group bacterium GW2011_GWD2_38_11]|nr:MAG: hypothetical protein US70_C0008G0037 [Parcubacteria group bacterium GW2011_GWD2_38_11]
MKVFQVMVLAVVFLSVLVAPTLAKDTQDQLVLSLDCRYCLKGIDIPEMALLQELLADQASWELEAEVMRQENEELLLELQNVPFGINCREETLQIFKAFLL